MSKNGFGTVTDFTTMKQKNKKEACYGEGLYNMLNKKLFHSIKKGIRFMFYHYRGDFYNGFATFRD